MRRARGKSKPKARRPVPPPIRDPGPIRAVDSEDQAGTYARPCSARDTGESDDGIFAQGPLPPRESRKRRRKEAHR